MFKFSKYLGDIKHTANLMIGMPNYDIYKQHMQNNHPNQNLMSYEEFFKQRQIARFGGNGNVKCC